MTGIAHSVAAAFARLERLDGVTGAVVPRLFGLVLGVAGWYGLASVFPNRLMPFPGETLALTVELVATGVVTEHLLATSKRILLGFAGSMVVGVTVGTLMGLDDYARKFFLPYVVVGMSVSAVAWAAVGTLVFGFSVLAPVAATVLTTFPFVTVHVWKAVEDVDDDLTRMSRSFDVSLPRMVRRQLLPDVTPGLFSASRFGLAISWKIVTLAEMFAASNGVGYRLFKAYQRFRFEEAWSWAAVFVIVILLIEYGVFRPLERRVFAYRSEARPLA